MDLSTVKLTAANQSLFNSLPISTKTKLLEFAAVIIFVLKFGTCFLPDYTLLYLDSKTDF